MISSCDAAALPKIRPQRAKSSILHVISLARLAIVHTRNWAANFASSRVRPRAGLHVAVKTVGGILEEKGDTKPPPSTAAAAKKRQPVKAKYPNHVWHCPARGITGRLT